jgi:phage terminase large subunit
MIYKRTIATDRIKAMKVRIRAVQGGTSASKTVSIMMYLIAKSQKDEVPTLTSVVAESFPHLRRGAMRDFEMILKGHDYWKDSLWDKTNSVYTFESGSKIEFFSADQGDKLRGARRDRLFINEANNVAFEAFEQLEVRTKDFVYLDWNPSHEFWFYTEVLPKRTDVEHIILTYLDNDALDPAIVASIEQRKGRKGWWQVYGLGQLGEVEGKIYKDWVILDELPKEARALRYGLDFGYSNDPSSLVAIYKYNDAYILDEICFQKEMSNRMIAETILSAGKGLVIADSAEPKSIDEIATYGINIIGANKGRDSVANGIQFVQDQKIMVTKRSINIIREYRNYLWVTDKDGKILNEPEHTYSHSMDAIRYGIAYNQVNGPQKTYQTEGVKPLFAEWGI